MSLFSYLRILVHLRKLAHAADRLVAIEESRLELDRARLAIEHPPLAAAPLRKVEFSTPTVDDWQGAIDVERKRHEAGL